MEMSRSKSLFISLIAALFITSGLSFIGFSADNRTVARILLWQYAIPAWMVAPGGPLLYVDAQGTPHYEGSPMLLLILPVGFLLGILIYTVASYLLLRWFVHRRAGAA
jgi:hypothetical protein